MTIRLKFLQDELLSPEFWIFGMLWIVILLPKSVQLLYFLCIAYLLCKKCNFRLKLDSVSLAIFGLFFVHIFSILYNILVFETENARILAGINTASLWLLVIPFYCYYSIFKKLDKNDYLRIGRYAYFNLFILFLEGLLTIYLYYFRKISEFHFYGKCLYTTTYLSGKAFTKFFGFNDFSNMNVIYIFLLTILIAPYIKEQKKIFQIFIIVQISFCVLIVSSRIAFAVYGFALLYYFNKITNEKYKKIIIFFAIFISLLLVILFFKPIYIFFRDYIVRGNEGSNSLRGAIIKTSIQEAWQKSPIWGMGIKRYFVYGFPLGSHSTYVGFFYKTGIIGLFLGLFLFAKVNINVFKRIKKDSYVETILSFLLSLIILFAIEDIDGSNWCIIVYFSLMAILSCSGFEKNVKKENVAKQLK